MCLAAYAVVIFAALFECIPLCAAVMAVSSKGVWLVAEPRRVDNFRLGMDRFQTDSILTSCIKELK